VHICHAAHCLNYCADDSGLAVLRAPADRTRPRCALLVQRAYSDRRGHLVGCAAADNAPNAKFVTASLGQTAMPASTSSVARPGGGTLILEAMLNVANGTKFPEFAGNVAAVYTHPLLHNGRGSSGSHYGDDAETYMNVGEAMGTAMVKLLKADQN
jgi:hypothetical protein